MENLSTQIANELLELTSQLPRVQASMTRELKKAFAEYQRDMLAAVSRADIMGVTARRYQEKRALALVKSVKELTTKAYREIHKATEAQLIDIAGVSAESMLNVVNGVSGGDLLTHTLTSPQLKHLVKHSVIDGATSAEWWGKQAANTQFKFKSVVQDSLINGEGTDAIARKIRGTRANNFTDGFMNTAYNNARSLTHTSVQNVANESRLEMMNENDDVIEGIEWLSTLDGHTTQICKSLDGLVWDLEHKPVGHSQQWAGSTAHWQCRSTQVPVLKGFSDLPKAKQSEFKGSRASMDGEVSGSINYDEWLKKKDFLEPSFVERTLGTEKYKLWRKHGLSMTDMVDQHNNPLTVAQLKAQFGATKKVVKPKPTPKVKKPVVKKTVAATKTKTGVEELSAKDAKKQLNDIVSDNNTDTRYHYSDSGEASIRFRPDRSSRKFSNNDIVRQQLGEVKVVGLSDAASSVVLHAVNETNDILARYRVQGLRGVKTGAARGANASMGDGVLSINRKHFNKFATSLDPEKAKKAANIVAIELEKEQLALDKIKRKIQRLKDNEFGTKEYYYKRSLLIKEHNTQSKKANRLIDKLDEMQPHNFGDPSKLPKSEVRWNNEWKVGDDLKDRPFSAGSYQSNGVDKIRNTIFHESGHQVHQQYGVTTYEQYINPPLEQLINTLYGYKGANMQKAGLWNLKGKPVVASGYMKKNAHEWFAENFSLYHNSRKELADPTFKYLIESIENDTLEDFVADVFQNGYTDQYTGLTKTIDMKYFGF